MNVRRLGGTILLAMAMAAPALAQDLGTVEVTVARANIRATASPTSRVLAQVTRGMDLDLISVEGDWYHVRVPVTGGRVTAYISRKVSRLSASHAGGPTPVGPPMPVSTSPAFSVASPATTVPMPLAPVTAAPSGSVPVDRTGLSVTVSANGAVLALAPRTLRVIEMAGKVDSLAKAAPLVPATGTLTGASGDQSSATYVWMADGTAADRVMNTRRPTFLVTYRNVPGVSSDDFLPVIIQLTPAASGVRLVGALRGRADEAARTTDDWNVVHDLKQDLVRATIEPVDFGTAKITPTADLAPGEYAVALRLSAKDKLSGATLLGPEGEGRIFAICWDFQVK